MENTKLGPVGAHRPPTPRASDDGDSIVSAALAVGLAARGWDNSQLLMACLRANLRIAETVSSSLRARAARSSGSAAPQERQSAASTASRRRSSGSRAEPERSPSGARAEPERRPRFAAPGCAQRAPLEWCKRLRAQESAQPGPTRCTAM